MEALGHEVSQRRIDDPNRVTIAHGVVGRPARPQDAVADRLVELYEEEHRVIGVVRVEEIAFAQQRCKRKERQDE